jgi:hypothetical protein
MVLWNNNGEMTKRLHTHSATEKTQNIEGIDVTWTAMFLVDA